MNKIKKTLAGLALIASLSGCLNSERIANDPKKTVIESKIDLPLTCQEGKIISAGYFSYQHCGTFPLPYVSCQNKKGDLVLYRIEDIRRDCIKKPEYIWKAITFENNNSQ
ncbi:MAG: hypothetical protein WC413_00960 [Candidatus Nanoarchaeia archaeon]